MRMLPSKVVPFSFAIAFSWGRVKSIQKRVVWTRFFFFEEGGKIVLKKMDSFGQSLILEEMQNQSKHSNGNTILVTEDWKT